MVLLMMLLTTATAWATITGSGSSTDPYVINTEDDWNTAAANSAYWYNGVYVELGHDLNFSGKTFTIYGGEFNSLTIHFDGRGHTISGVNAGDLSSEYHAALFSRLRNGTITGITVANSHFKAQENAAGIVGINAGTVSDCHVLSSVTIEVTEKHCGGITVENGETGRTGTITDCTVGAVFKLPVLIYNDNEMGGIAGDNYSGTITDCLFYGTVVTANNAQTLFGCIAEKYFAGCTYSGNCYRPVSYSGGGSYAAFKTGDGNSNATIVHVAISGIPTGANVSPAAPYIYDGNYWYPSGTYP